MRAACAIVFLAACGGSSAKPATVESKPLPEQQADPHATGADECDAVVRRTLCAFDNEDAEPETRGDFEETIRQWREDLREDRDYAIEGCLQNLDDSRSWFMSVDCWVIGDEFDAREMPDPGYSDPGQDIPMSAMPYPAGYPLTGAVECDALIARTVCAYDQAGAAMPAEAKKAFQDSVGAWAQALSNDATRQATIDACKMSLDAARAGFQSMGCW